MSLFSFFSRRNKKIKRKFQAPKAKLHLEALEDRFVPSSANISGYVFADANNNGIYDPGETPIANAPVQLKDANNNIVGSTTTDATGFYQFTQDNSINQVPQTLTKTLVFPTTQTDFVLSGGIDQFNPSLGQLQSVQITHSGSITSDIKVENTSTASTSVIKGTVGGSLELNGPGVDIPLNLSQNAGTFNASQYDGTLDYAGSSGTDFGAKVASGTNSITLTGAAMAPFIGSGTVSMTENADAASSAIGGGNLSVLVNSSGMSQVTVVYTYIPSNALKPGNYTIVEPTQPPGFTDGKESAQGVVILHQPNIDVIPVAFDGINNSANNDFGKLQPASISGNVYYDANNNGIKDPGESGIQGTTVTLSGTNDQGPVSQTAIADANGFYQFTNLLPGTYSIQETQPATWLDGKDTAGTLGGIVTNDLISNIVLPSGAGSLNNNFGELKGSSLSGNVYFDANNNGIKDAGETGIQGTTVTLSGTTDQGPVSQTATTDANGFYQFTNLLPGSYSVQEAQPPGWLDGKDTAGTLGGTVTNDLISSIAMPAGASSLNNNFGELKASSLSGYVYADGNNNGSKDPGETGIAGTTVTLTGSNGNGPVSQTTTTDVNGFYQFTTLLPGTYAINETQPANYSDGKDSIGSQGGVQGNDVFSNINLAAGVDGVNNNFGELAPSSLAGYVYMDANNNGVKDPGEAPIAGVGITLSGTDGNGPVNKVAVTDANGFYQFQNLLPGTYAINETQPANYLDGLDAVGSQGGTTGNDVLSNIALAAATQGTNNNFGELAPAGLSGYVYVDANNNGIKDPGEPGIAGTTVTLTGFNDQGPMSLTATTDVNGLYQFQNLRPGTYAITETQPANYVDGKDTIGTPGGTTANDNFSNILLAAGVLGANNNFGEMTPANADLGIVKTASASSVLVGSTINYTLTVTNYGTSTAQNVQVVDNLPPDGSYQSASGTGWTISQVGGTLTATLPSLAVNATAQILVTIKAPAVADTLTNTATVSSATPDSNPNNNSSSVTTTVFNTPTTSANPPANPFGALPALGKIQEFGINLTQYMDPVLVGQMTFVSGTYQTLLGRAPTTTEFWTAVDQLQAGTTSTTTIVANVINSSEYRADQATALYQTFLGRSPTSSELATAVQALKGGLSENNFALNLVNSAEYQSSHPSAATMVAGLYQDILNQTPDNSTQLQAATALANQAVTSFAQSLMNSPAALSIDVNDAYYTLLRRAPTAAETQNWVNQLQSGQITFDQLETNLLTSPEFYQLAYVSTKK
jgi:uncharacterized repeat protein (TIGR01451 family)